jgi:hypothetical protein
MSSYFAIQVIICVGKLHEESVFRSWLIEIVIVYKPCQTVWIIVI